MIEIDIILGNRWVPPCMEGIICMSAALVFTAHKFVLANCGIVHGIMAWSIDGKLQLDDVGENE
jgi:hypothetical protein